MEDGESGVRGDAGQARYPLGLKQASDRVLSGFG